MVYAGVGAVEGAKKIPAGMQGTCKQHFLKTGNYDDSITHTKLSYCVPSRKKRKSGGDY
jgi:hypothetical protein